MSDIEDQIASARAHIRKMAKVNPHIYPQYGAWLAAKRAVVEAKAAEKAAKAAWDRASCKEKP